MGVEDALIHILSVFQLMWSYTATLVRRLNRKNEELVALLKMNYPQQAVVGFDKLLSENLCIRNRDVSEKLCISPKTTIKHMKRLEENNILYSVKRGREIFYFNIALLDLLKQMIEVSDNGEKKPQTFD